MHRGSSRQLQPIVVVVFLALASSPQTQQTQHVFGSVETLEGAAVAGATISAGKGVSNVTTQSGRFSFPVPPLEVGEYYDFKVEKWLVVDPCNLKRGRAVIPKLTAEGLLFRVVPPGTAGLTDESLACIYIEDAAHFRPRKSVPRGSVDRPVSAGTGPGMASLLNSPDYHTVRFQSAIQETILSAMSQRVPVQCWPHEDDQDNNSGWRSFGSSGLRAFGSPAPPSEFVRRQAQELELSPEQLDAALHQFGSAVQAQPAEFYRKGLVALHEGRYLEARKYLADSIASGKGDIFRYVSLGRAEYETGHYPAAEAALRKVLAVHPNDPLVLTNLGLVLTEEAKFAEAEQLHQRALELNVQALGPNDPEVADVLRNMSVLYGYQGNLAKAESLLRRALAIDGKALGSEEPETATLQADLATVYWLEGKSGDAEGYLQHALEIDEKVLGPEHPETVDMRLDLAIFTALRGDIDESELLLLRIQGVVNRTLGPDHPDLAMVASVLGNIYAAREDYNRAEACMREALRINELNLGPDHPIVGAATQSLADVYTLKGHYLLAEPLYYHALETIKKTMGDDHPLTASVLASLGNFNAAQGKYPEAESFYKKALGIAEKVGPDSFATGMIILQFADFYADLHRCSEARPLFQRALPILEKSFGKKNEMVVNIRKDMEHCRSGKH